MHRASHFLMFINFYSVLTVSNLSSTLKCILLLPSDCVYVRYCNAVISIINKIILQSRGQIVHCMVAKRPGGETSKGRNVQGAN